MTSTPDPRSKGLYVVFLTILGAYLNLAAYGFQYPEGSDYNFMLPIAAWLRDPSLYPRDPIRNAFTHVQSFYWPIVAAFSSRYGTEHALFALFLLTKLIFFVAVALLVARRVDSSVLGGCVIGAIALSGLLNGQTPIGGTIILDQLSENAGLGLALALLAGVLLVEGQWLSASFCGALSVYIDAIQFVHILPAFALFAALDWRNRKGRVIAAGLLGAGVSLPWYIHFHQSFLTNYPSDYVSALLVHYPLHITLRWTPSRPVIEIALLFTAAVCMALVARYVGLQTEARLELLATAYLAVTVFGAAAGWFWLTPTVARFMPQRADSLLIPYVFLLIEIYGAKLLELQPVRRPVAASLLSAFTIASPLINPFALVLSMIPWLEPKGVLDRTLARPVRRIRKIIPLFTATRVVGGLCALGILAAFALSLEDASRLWDFNAPPSAEERDCMDAQIWAREHSQRDAIFMVPPVGCGFRFLSERASWGEWSDGNAMYFYPAFADTFLERVKTLDPLVVPQGVGIINSEADIYRRLPWERIREIAVENKLGYIVQFRTTTYPIASVYSNATFAIYESSDASAGAVH